MRVVVVSLSNVAHDDPSNLLLLVLGEELTCWTDHADGSRTVFRAEQVSHHPPMSCFFMFNETHNVYFECNVEFGVTFHGNSVTISTKGYGEIRLGNEVYTISKYIPDLKIDSVVFGSRRQSWRGEWEITCNESGLGAGGDGNHIASDRDLTTFIRTPRVAGLRRSARSPGYTRPAGGRPPLRPAPRRLSESVLRS